MKVCPKCNASREDSVNDCQVCNRKRARAWAIAHKDENSKRASEWNKKNRERRNKTSAKSGRKNKKSRKNNHLLKTYGLSLESYQALFEKQNGVCRICKKAESILDKRTGEKVMLAVDHDHATGRIRGLLCGNCNRALGLLGDSPEILRTAADYLEGKC